MSDHAEPLCVDLDGTLIRTDVLFESLVLLLKTKPWEIFRLPLWMLRGRSYLKSKIAECVDLDVTLLPYNRPFLLYLKERKKFGQRLILTTASTESVARAVSRHLEIFDDVIASDKDRNLKGSCKRDVLIDTYGERGFDYAGNSNADVEVWANARFSIVVNPDRGVLKQAYVSSKVVKVFPRKLGTWRALLKSVRPHQWSKNILLFVPLLLAHRLLDFQLFISTVLAFTAFCMCAASVYLLNDLLDLQADRQHPSKRYRSLAQGDLKISSAMLAIPVFLLLSAVCALTLPLEFQSTLLIYYVSTLTYSLYLKQIALLDTIVLAGLYTIRLIAGAAAVGVSLSFWLMGFSIFMFFSLALVKRYSEMLLLRSQKQGAAKGRDYFTADTEILSQFGICSGFMAVLVLALYINSAEVIALYRHPELIWTLCPVLLYWVSRVWFLARRGVLQDDPVVFAIEDRVSHFIGVATLAILWAAI